MSQNWRSSNYISGQFAQTKLLLLLARTCKTGEESFSIDWNYVSLTWWLKWSHVLKKHNQQNSNVTSFYLKRYFNSPLRKQTAKMTREMSQGKELISAGCSIVARVWNERGSAHNLTSLSSRDWNEVTRLETERPCLSPRETGDENVGNTNLQRARSMTALTLNRAPAGWWSALTR